MREYKKRILKLNGFNGSRESLEKFRDAIIGEIRKNSRNSKLKSEDSLRDLSLQLNTMNKRIWNWVIRFLLNFGDYNCGVTE